MISPKRVYIVDFDNTILDIEKLSANITSKFPGKKVFLQEYEKAKKISGHFNPQNLPEKYRNYFLNAPFSKYLFPNAIDNIKRIKKLGRVIIFSYGDPDYQNLKIKLSGVETVVGSENVVIVQNKKDGVEKLIRKLKKEFREITIIDDVSEVLEKAFEKFPQVITVWIRYGKYKKKVPLMRNAVTAEVKSFEEATGFAERFVATITFPKSHIKFPILKEINKDQISDVISLTKKDKKISEYTHDNERFKNRKSFSSWKSRGKIIYTLTARTGKLLGLIWFAKKSYANISYTFAIRTYKPVRGKGLSYKFMSTVFENFFEVYKKQSLWLSFNKNNAVAEHLYRKFGFKFDKNKGSEAYMIYSKSSLPKNGKS